jgi:hypothetical protein
MLYKIMSLPMAVFTCTPHFLNFIFWINLLKHPCPLSAWIRRKYISLRFLFVQISMLGTKSLSDYRPPFRLSPFPGCPNILVWKVNMFRYLCKWALFIGCFCNCFFHRIRPSNLVGLMAKRMWHMCFSCKNKKYRVYTQSDALGVGSPWYYDLV